MKIIIYTNETCPYCKQVKEELTKNNIEFENRNTTEYVKEWNNIVSFTGMPNVPTLFFNNEYHAPGRDFGGIPNLLEKIKSYTPCDFSIELQALEKIKTLTYNMAAAFGRTNQVLVKIEEQLKKQEDEHKSNN
tara:strand:- start:32 stop:430 length:399 start_codon:yes stop_codon:yes gene_type:complete